MFVESDLRLGYESTITLEFVALGGREIVHLDGVVRWFNARGFGVQFAPMGARETHALSILFDQAARALARRRHF